MELDHKLLEYLRFYGCLSSHHKLLYIATPKVACTSLKWWFADLVGFSGILSKATDSGESSPELVIHDTFLKVAPSVTGLTPEMLAVPLQSDEYFRFAVVRNPYKRIFSAWQSKLLMREPLQCKRYLKSDFFLRPIGSAAEDIAFAFESFLEHLLSEEAPDFWDDHWTPQAILLRPDLISYTKLAQIENVRELSAALSAHLGPEIPDLFAVRSLNESLIPFLPEFITDKAAQLVRLLYSQDFEQFGYDTKIPEAKEKFSGGELKVALQAIELIRGRHQRLSEVRANRDREVFTLNGQVNGLNVQVNGLNVQVNSLNAQVSSLNAQVSSLNVHISNLLQQINTLNGQIASLNDQIASLNQAVVEREKQIAELLNSRSWRLTKPLRFLWRIFV